MEELTGGDTMKQAESALMCSTETELPRKGEANVSEITADFASV
jgi:hypothetical protein